MDFYKWFFLEEGRTPAGLFSLSHILTVTLTLAIFLTLAVFLGKKFKGDYKASFNFNKFSSKLDSYKYVFKKENNNYYFYSVEKVK